MLYFKNIQKLVTSLALLVTIISFSGFTERSYIEQPKTELVYNNCNNAKATKYTKALFNTSQKVLINQYSLFQFKIYLVTHNFDFNIKLKSQKEIFLQTLDFNSLLKQNLIAQLKVGNSLPLFIE